MTNMIGSKKHNYSQLSANWHPCKRTVLLMNTFFTFNFCLPVKSTFLSITLHIPVSRNSLVSHKKVAYTFPLADIHPTFLSCHLWESLLQEGKSSKRHFFQFWRMSTYKRVDCISHVRYGPFLYAEHSDQWKLQSLHQYLEILQITVIGK